MDGLLGWDREVHPSRDDSLFFFLALHFAFFQAHISADRPVDAGLWGTWKPKPSGCWAEGGIVMSAAIVIIYMGGSISFFSGETEFTGCHHDDPEGCHVMVGDCYGGIRHATPTTTTTLLRDSSA